MKHAIYLAVALVLFGCSLVTGCVDDSSPGIEQPQRLSRSQAGINAEDVDSLPNAFFYFEDTKLPLFIDSTREVLIADGIETISIPVDSLYGVYKQGQYAGYVLDKGSSSRYADPEQIVAIEDILTDGTPFFPEFMAVVKDVSSVNEVKEIAAELGCEVKYQLESNPSFIRMALLPGTTKKVLETSQRLYETGLFRSVDPGLIPVIDDQQKQAASMFALTAQNEQWNLASPYGVNAVAAWNYTKGSRDVTLAVLDGAFASYQRPELKNHMHGYSYNPFGYSNMHGLQCASIAAGDGSVTGYWGVAPGVSVMQIGIMPDPNSITAPNILAEGIVNGIYAAINHGADVLNCSWSYTTTSTVYLNSVITALKDAMSSGRGGKGSVVVFASGNDKIVEQPGKSLADALIVGAVNSNGIVWESSGKGPQVDLVAPGEGVKILSGTGYAVENGTSYAAPHVAGTAALILSMRPDLTQKEVCQVILDNATGRCAPSDSYGRGTVDAYNALKALNCDGISIILPTEAHGGQLVLDKASYMFFVSGAPKGSNWTLDIPGSTPDEWMGGYKMSGISSPQTITIKATVDYMHRRFAVTTPLKVIPVRPVISSITKAGHPAGALEPNSFDLFVDCNNWGAEITWEITNQSGTHYTVEEPYYAHDVGYLDKPGFYKTIKASDNFQWAECSIEVTVAIPGLGYDHRSIKVNGTGDNARVEVL